MDISLIIIGDEILHGNRLDKHFMAIKDILAQRGLRLAKVQYLPDDRELLIQELRQSFTKRHVCFVTGGIGATPDDHTRQAAAAALNLPIVRHPEAASFITENTLARGQDLHSAGHLQRLQMADFPENASIIPNPFNRVAGFFIHEHYFVPGFPEMAHPMLEWVLDTHYADHFNRIQHSIYSSIIYGIPESELSPIMEAIEAQFTDIHSFSLPTIIKEDDPYFSQGQQYKIEFGIKASGIACEQLDTAWVFAKECLSKTNAIITTEEKNH
jgi:molybdopterin-biosynthesis enzyme MoeA-like protein